MMTTPRRLVLKSAAAATLAAAVRPALAQATPMIDLRIDATRPARAVNPMVLGNNLDWTNKGQGLYTDASLQHPPGWLDLADRLSPTALRFPGGTNADFFHWKTGLGRVSERGRSRTLERKDEAVLLGTDEFLAFCKRWKSEPLITVNVATGSADEAAQWLRYTNKRATALPRVRYWEIGNEPYLDASAPETQMNPAEFARRVNLIIRAMKAVDPEIEFGVPLRTDTLGGVDATPFKGFNEAVLKGVTEPFEWAALHSSYYPVTFTKSESPAELFGATMAATRVLQADIEATRTALRSHYPRRTMRLAFTEYNALYSLDILRYGIAAVFLSKTDRYIESMAGALYVADALRIFSLTDDLLMANFWALNGNWWFGAISHEFKPRPQFHVLEAWRDLISGNLLPVEVKTPMMATGKAGFVPAFADTEQVSAHALLQGSTVRAAVINRHPQQAALLRIGVIGVLRGTVQIRELTSDHYFGAPVRWVERQVDLRDGRAEFTLSKHSFAVLTFKPR